MLRVHCQQLPLVPPHGHSRQQRIAHPQHYPGQEADEGAQVGGAHTPAAQVPAMMVQPNNAGAAGPAGKVEGKGGSPWFKAIGWQAGGRRGSKHTASKQQQFSVCEVCSVCVCDWWTAGKKHSNRLSRQILLFKHNMAFSHRGRPPFWLGQQPCPQCFYIGPCLSCCDPTPAVVSAGGLVVVAAVTVRVLLKSTLRHRAITSCRLLHHTLGRACRRRAHLPAVRAGG